MRFWPWVSGQLGPLATPPPVWERQVTLTWGLQGPPMYLSLGYEHTIQIQKAGQAKVEKLKTKTFPLQRASPRGAWTQGHGYPETGDREHMDTDTFLGNYSGNHTAVQARTPLSTPDSGNTACPQLQNPLLQVLDPWALPRSRPWPCPRRGALRVTVGRRQGRGREVGPMLTLLGSLTQLRAERPLPPARRGESAFLTTEMRTRPKLLTLTAACL